jgi:hypothetical protein
VVSTAASSPSLRSKLSKARANTLQDGICPTVRALYILSPVIAPLFTNDASERPPTLPQHRCSPMPLSQQTCKSCPLIWHPHTSPRQSRCCQWFFRFVLQKDIDRLSAAELHDTHTKLRKLQTATLKISRRPQRCLSPFIFLSCTGTKLAMWMYISSSVVPEINDFNSVRVYCSFPGLKKIRD